MPTHTPIKTYILTKLENSPILETSHNDKPFLWADMQLHKNTHSHLTATIKCAFFSATDQIRLAVNSPQGPIVAAIRLNSLAGGARVLLGKDPDTTPKEQWMRIPRQGWRWWGYSFTHQGKKYLWNR
jgi:hypothetical protein